MKTYWLVGRYARGIVTGRYVEGLIYDGSNYKIMKYTMSISDFGFSGSMKRFEIVSMYSKNKNPKNLEICLFERKNK